MAVDDGIDTIGNILVIDYQMRGRVALVGPKGRAEFRSPDGLTPGDGARCGLPSSAPVVSDLPTDGPRGPTQEGVRWVTCCSISPERAREVAQRGSPIGLALMGLGGRVAANNCGLRPGAVVSSCPRQAQLWQTW